MARAAQAALVQWAALVVPVVGVLMPATTPSPLPARALSRGAPAVMEATEVMVATGELEPPGLAPIRAEAMAGWGEMAVKAGMEGLVAQA